MAKKKKRTRPKRSKIRRKSFKIPVWVKNFLIMIALSFSVLVIKHFAFDKPAFEKMIEARRPDLIVDLLTINSYSRPGIPLRKVNGIVIHYVANPGSSAKENRDYFEGLKDTHATKASSHFVIGLEGEIVQCIPLNEIAYTSNRRNSDTISIECCHPRADGAFYEGTYDSLVNLTAWICKKYGLSSSQIIRHYDITGKACPLYFVEHEEKWEEFRQKVEQKMKNY